MEVSSLTSFWIAVVAFSASAEICLGPVCRFTLEVALFRTMSHRVLNKGLLAVSLNRSKFPDDVVTADGFTRNIITINGRFPGPTLEVIEGVQIIAVVKNKLSQRAFTIHWHGIDQYNTNYMDGAEGVTQCSILPGQTWTYQFVAQPAGTHFYHAHSSTLRLDGLQGMLIVHTFIPDPPNYFPVLVGDWQHRTSEESLLELSNLCENGASEPPYRQNQGIARIDCTIEGADVDPRTFVSVMIGGRNRSSYSLPVTEYSVKRGQRYRFRVVNSGETIPLEISIDNHQLTIVATDGQDIQPIVVDSFFVFVAESVDFEIVADQVTTGRFWFRANSPCFNVSFYSLAIVSYDDSGSNTDPISTPTRCTSDRVCRVFNCPVGRYPESYCRQCIPMVAAQSTLTSEQLRYRYGVGEDESTVQTYFMNWAMVAGPSVNGRRFKSSTTPLFQKDALLTDCSVDPCGTDGCKCACTNILDLPFNRVVQFVISNLTPDPNVRQDGYHTIHAHGYEFAVMSEQFPPYDVTTGQIIHDNVDITCNDDLLCAHPTWSNQSVTPSFANVSKPVVKDTVLLPVRGYVVIRMRTLNPGNWLFHCHVDTHMLGGMALILRVAPERLPPPPDGFPTCSNFDKSNDSANLHSGRTSVGSIREQPSLNTIAKTTLISAIAITFALTATILVASITRLTNQQKGKHIRLVNRSFPLID